MRKTHWRAMFYGGQFHAFEKVMKDPSAWRSLCGKWTIERLGKGPSVKAINPWAMCGRCDGFAQECRPK